MFVELEVTLVEFIETTSGRLVESSIILISSQKNFYDPIFNNKWYFSIFVKTWKCFENFFKKNNCISIWVVCHWKRHSNRHSNWHSNPALKSSTQKWNFLFSLFFLIFTIMGSIVYQNVKICFRDLGLSVFLDFSLYMGIVYPTCPEKISTAIPKFLLIFYS